MNTSQSAGSPEIAPLITAAAAGDMEAWEALVAQLAPTARAAARGYRLDDEKSEQVARIVFLRLYERLSLITEPRAVPGWVLTAAQQECLRQMRAGPGLRAKGTTDDALDPLIGPLSEALQQRVRLLEAIDRKVAVKYLELVATGAIPDPDDTDAEQSPVGRDVLEQLRRIQQSSLGTPSARAIRRQSRASDICEILDRADIA